MAEVAPPRARRDAGTNISTTEAAVTRNNNKDNVTQLLSLATVSSDNKAARISQNDAWTGLNSTSTTSPMDYVKHHSAKPWPTLSGRGRKTCNPLPSLDRAAVWLYHNSS